MSSNKFAYHCTGRWEAGSWAQRNPSDTVVVYDQECRSYDIRPNEFDDFVAWVAATFGPDDKPEQDRGEETINYLWRIGVAIQSPH